jgi:hypothetical protein
MPKVRDVTAELLVDSATGPGKYTQRVAGALPARKQTPSLMATLAAFEARHDKTMGRISKPLAYSKAMPAGARDHGNLIRLIKGGQIAVCAVTGPPPRASVAHRDAPYYAGDANTPNGYYILRIGACPTEVADGALAGRKRRRR